jgi:hypothetical protein
MKSLLRLIQSLLKSLKHLEQETSVWNFRFQNSFWKGSSSKCEHFLPMQRMHQKKWTISGICSDLGGFSLIYWPMGLTRLQCRCKHVWKELAWGVVSPTLTNLMICVRHSNIFPVGGIKGFCRAVFLYRRATAQYRAWHQLHWALIL